MKKNKENWTTKKPWGTLTSKKSSKRLLDSDVVAEKSVKTTESDVSVFTKTTNPKVVVESENLKEKCNISLQKCHCKHKILKCLCFIILSIVVLMTFFLALKTYNTVNELADYILM